MDVLRFYDFLCCKQVTEGEVGSDADGTSRHEEEKKDRDLVVEPTGTKGSDKGLNDGKVKRTKSQCLVK